MKETFRKIAARVSAVAGSAWVFLLAVTVIITWALTGPVFKFSDTWQLVVNTGTTIVTFLMVFLIQNTQNRDARAVHIKLDELIRATKARDRFIDIEDLSDEELSKLSRSFSRLRESEAPDPALEKLHSRINQVMNKRLISIPGEEAVTKYIPFTGQSGRKNKK